MNVSKPLTKQQSIEEATFIKIDQIIQKIRQTCRLISRDNSINKYFDEAQTTKQEVLDNIIRSTIDLQKIKTILQQKKGSILAAAKIINFLHKYFEGHSFSSTDQLDRINWVLDMENKLKAIGQFIDSFQDFKDNIVTLPSRNFVEVWRKIHVNHVGKPEKIKQQQQLIKMIIQAATSAVISQVKAQGWFYKKLTFGLQYSKSIFYQKKSSFQCLSYYRNPSVAITKQVWNLGQEGPIKHMQRVLHPIISVNQQLYIPYIVERDSYPDIHKKTEGQQVKVRLLSSKPLKFECKSQVSCYPVSSIQPVSQSNKSGQGNHQKQNQTILIYINGGGFIALSSFTMQTYTRKWAIELGIPVFSIDYRKPPEHRFPEPVQDAYIAYRFITQRIHQYVNIKPKKIILAGDSAGANIVCSLMGIILKQKLAPVHSMFLAYPAIDTRKVFSPSRINCFSDPILYPSLLILCIKQYLGDIDKYSSNPFASPIMFTEANLGGKQGDQRWPLKWPKTTIMVGKKDPLYDDSLVMMQKMVASHIPCHCQVYQNFGHGFLSMEQVITDCPQLIKDSIRFLKELIQ